ncbi:UPF0721 transmembrane protein [Hypericibacter terrae]|uniref:Probable membrane transporter protein n=1 Tax=Hypericibacter terrae TaxID=2602015 RepID=A0A5J6MKX3_9PROT|nr:sulfite exporter TauE/SafE family protein [Hypericibacter terrae]QEX18053.1 UPF0721 transmembrane protein [Hypericibacter terrae]
MRTVIGCPYAQKAFGYAAPIGALAGLIGLGGGEFRLPVLMHVIGFPAKASVPLNLIVSLTTLAAALLFRSHVTPAGTLQQHLPEMAGLLCGGVASAFWGTRLVQRLKDERLVAAIGVLLAGIGVLMLVEVAFPFEPLALSPDALPRFSLGIGLGVGIGFVSSLLGVAGGELLIPSLMFIFGADIKTAGTASLFISLVIVAVGIWRYGRMGAIPKGGGPRRIIAAMSLGSIIGGLIGGLAAAIAPVAALKIVLGVVLLAAAGKTLWSHRSAPN